MVVPLPMARRTARSRSERESLDAPSVFRRTAGATSKSRERGRSCDGGVRFPVRLPRRACASAQAQRHSVARWKGPSGGIRRIGRSRSCVRPSLPIRLAPSRVCEKPIGTRGVCSQCGSCGAMVRSVVRPCLGFRSSHDCATTTTSAASRPSGRSRRNVSHSLADRDRESSSLKFTRRWWRCRSNLMAVSRTPRRSRPSQGIWPATTLPIRLATYWRRREIWSRRPGAVRRLKRAGFWE